MVAAQVDVVMPWWFGQRDPNRSAAQRFAQSWIDGELEQFRTDVRLGWWSGRRPWCKAGAVANGLAHPGHGVPPSVRAPVLVIHDADVLPHPGTLQAAVQAVLDGAPWAMPHGPVRRLSPLSSVEVMAGARLSEALELDEPAYNGVAGGGVVVLPRVTYDDVPLDRRFIGWGQEDTSWAKALRVLVGEPVRFNGPLWHLWHEPQRRDSRRYGSPNSRALGERYRLAMSDRAAMRRLVDDGKAA